MPHIPMPLNPVPLPLFSKFRQQVAALEAEVQSRQREAEDAATALQRQQAEHQASQEAAAARIAGGCLVDPGI